MNEGERQFWMCCIGTLVIVVGLEWWIRGLIWVIKKMSK